MITLISTETAINTHRLRESMNNSHRKHIPMHYCSQILAIDENLDIQQATRKVWALPKQPQWLTISCRYPLLLWNYKRGSSALWSPLRARGCYYAEEALKTAEVKICKSLQWEGFTRSQRCVQISVCSWVERLQRWPHSSHLAINPELMECFCRLPMGWRPIRKM
jgi:hypothetical protein